MKEQASHAGCSVMIGKAPHGKGKVMVGCGDLCQECPAFVLSLPWLMADLKMCRSTHSRMSCLMLMRQLI